MYAYIDFVRKNGYFEHRRNEQAKYWMYETINEHLRDSFYQNLSSTVYEVGGQGKTEKWNNTLPSYAMVHLMYKFSKAA